MAGSSTNAPYATRTLEIWTAAAVGLVGVVVIIESLTHDIGWNETGPGSGYFPFRVALLLMGAAAIRMIQVRLPPSRFALRRTRKPDTTNSRGAGVASEGERLASGPAIFVTRQELQRSLSVFWPTLARVVAMFPLGCYVPSAVYLAWMMRRHGGHGWLLSAAYGAAVMVAFFLIFDRWFGVPLSKGPVEAVLGIY